MGRRIAEVVWREDGAPICFLGGSAGNVCDEPDDNFVLVPLEPLWWHIIHWFNKLRRRLA